jgi:hypothetical protein
MPVMDLQSEGGGEVAASPNPDPGRGRPRASAVPLRARLWLAGAGLAALALIVVLLSVPSGATSSARADTRVSSASPATFRRALLARLDAQHAYYHWVVCVHSGAHFEGVPVVRCNVDFGDPHIEAYCSVFRGGHLLTSEDDPAISCAPDHAGKLETIVTYP